MGPGNPNNRDNPTTELRFFPSWVAGRPGYADRIRQIFNEHHQKHGMRMTQQRQHILDYLLNADRHVSMDEIYRALRSKGVGKVTVFRSLKVLEECGLLDRVTSSDGKTLYEINYERPHHDHLICVECGSVMEIRWPQVEKIQEKACREIGFEIAFHRHEVFGRCRSCAQKRQSAP